MATSSIYSARNAEPIHALGRSLPRAALLEIWACADTKLGGAAVLDYRVYFIGRDGHFLRAIDIQVASDQDAIARALELREGHEVEVWELVAPKVSKK
jgi:hypothetical protein